MPSNKQNPLIRRLAKKPPALVGGVSLKVEAKDDRHADLRLEHDGHRLQLKAAALPVPYPSGLRALLAAEPDIEAVIVERIPPGLKAAAEELGIGYLDVRGGGRLVGPGFVYVAQPFPALPGVARKSSPFAPKASRVVRALLSEPERDWRLSDIAALVNLNPGNVHRALSALVEGGYVERDGDNYVIANPGSMLEAWADISSPARERVSIPAGDGLRKAIRGVIKDLDGNAVVSGEFAAELLAPHLPAKSAVIHCLDAGAWPAVVSQVDERPSGNFPAVGLMGPAPGRLAIDLPDEGVAHFSRSVRGLEVVSPVQLYVDLYKQPGRGREAAEEVRRQLLGY
jgi:hypothetical protein